MKKIFTIGLLTLFFQFKGNAQVPTCDANVPFFQVDLSGQPSGSWISPWHTRVGQCCGVTNANECTSFEIILDSNAAMINFQIAGGAIPSGAMFYQINCGPPVAVGNPICISGVGPHHVTFCKPGNNENIYQITSIPIPIFPIDDSVRIGCSTTLDVYGLEMNTLTWQSVFPGTPGQYDSYLSCTSNCTSPVYTPASNAPAYVDYKICGFPIADECGYVGACDTLRIYNFAPLTATLSPTTGTFCMGGSGVTLSAICSGGDGNFTYIWRDPNNVIVSTSSTCQATVPGTYSVEISDGLYDAVDCPALFLSIPVIEVSPPEITTGSDQVLCADNPNAVLTATMANCTNVNWTGGAGIYSPGSTGTTVYYVPTPAEISSGQVVLTATTFGAGGGCTEVSDQTILTFPADISVSITTTSPVCYGDATPISANVTGGAGPITYLWNNGAATSTISIMAGNYCVNVEDTLGCFAVTCNNVISPDPLTISMTSLDATAGNNGEASATVTGGVAPYTYSWNTSPVQNTQTATGLTTGMYTVLVTDMNGCTISSSVIVNNPFCSGLQASATSTNILCHGNNNGTGVAAATGGNPPYAYEWQAPLSGTNDTITGLSAGTYLVLVTDSMGCIDAATITIIEPLQLINLMNHTDVTVAAGSDGTATANVSGGAMPYSYIWETFETTPSIGNLSPGFYTLNIIDINGCRITDSVLINEADCADFIIGVSSAPVSCFNGSDGLAIVVILNGNGPFTYDWSNGQTTSLASGLLAGTYSINVIDGAGCISFQTLTVIEPSPLSAALAPTQPSCDDVNDGTIELAVSGGTYPYSFNWSNGAQSEDLFAMPPGNYSVTITDDHNCTVSQNTSLAYPIPLSYSVSLTNVTCFNGSDGTINLTASGGTGALSYVWSSGATSQDISGISSGLYDVTITDQNGCTNTLPIEVLINEPEVILNNTTFFDCPVPGSGVALVTVSPIGGSNSNYQISFDNGATFQPAGDYDAFLPVDNMYSIIILDSNGCVSPVADLIDVNPEVIVDDVQFNFCFVQGDNSTTVTVSPTGGYVPDYFISFDNGNTYSPLSDYSETLSIGSTYNIVAQDTAGCLSLPYPITVNDAMLISATLSQFNIDNVSCHGMNDGSIDASVSGGIEPYSYNWSTNETTEDIGSLAAGNYTLTVTDSNGCVVSQNYTLTEPDSLSGTLAVSTSYNGYDVSCYSSNDGGIDLAVIGGTAPYQFGWSNSEISEDISSLASGTYSVTITDDNGCIYIEDITLNRPDSIMATEQIDDVLCNGFTNGAIDLTADGGVSPYTYLWNTNETTEDINGLAPGNYSVTITDDNGCTYMHQATVIELAPIIIAREWNNVLCFGENNGSINLTVNGGTSPYSFLWSTNETSEDISALATGVYSCLITDVNGCTVSDLITISQPDSLLSAISSPLFSNGHNISYNGGNDGSIDLTVTGGTIPYEFAWNNNATTEDLSGLTAGTYEVFVTDANGCTNRIYITINDPYGLDLPQGFSPDNDGRNDYFVIQGLEAYPVNLVTIFNRWGNKVFEAENYTNDWDGQRNRTEGLLPDGTYFVILEITTPEEIRLHGYVELRK